MKATEQTWKDVQKYFLDTFVICPEFNEKEALYVDMVEPGGMRVVDTNGDKGFVEFPYNIRSPLATRKEWWQYNDYACLVARIPARMWRKGVCSENTTMTRLLTNTLETSNCFNSTAVKQFVAYSDKFVSVLDGTDMYSSVALSKYWALASVSQTLFVLDKPVGKLSIKKKLVLLLKEFNKVPVPPQFKDLEVKYV